MIYMQKFQLYCTNFIYLHSFHFSTLCFELIDVLSANQHAENLGCIINIGNDMILKKMKNLFIPHKIHANNSGQYAATTTALGLVQKKNGHKERCKRNNGP